MSIYTRITSSYCVRLFIYYPPIIFYLFFRPRAAAVPPRQPHPLPITTPATASDSSGNASAPTNANSESPKKPISTETNDGSFEHVTAEQGVTTNGTSDETTVDQNGETKVAAETESTESLTNEEKSESAGAPDILVSKPPSKLLPPSSTTQPAVTSNVMCRFAGRCHNEGCTFRHPKVSL